MIIMIVFLMSVTSNDIIVHYLFYVFDVDYIQLYAGITVVRMTINGIMTQSYGVLT